MGQEIEVKGVQGAIAEVLPAPGVVGGYDPEVAARVLWRISEGETVRAATGAEGMKWAAWFYWLLRLPELERMHRVARRIAAYRHFDRAQEQIEKLIQDANGLSGNAVRALTAAQGALRDMAAVLNPSEFGERREVTPPVTVRIETTLDLKVGNAPPVDHGSVYEIAGKAMGTVVPGVEDVPVDGTRKVMLKPAEVKRTGRGEVKVYEREGEEDG